MRTRLLHRLALVVALSVVVGAGVLVVTSGGGGYRLRVQINDAAGLRKDFLVKIAGAPVGKVVDVQLDRADHAVAVLAIDKGAAPVGTDAGAAIRASNLLGEKYVDLTPGTVAHPAPSGFEIPSGRTSTPSNLDDVLSVLDPSTRLALGAFLVNQGDALVGRGNDLAATFAQIPPTLDAATQLVSGLAENTRSLGSLVDRSDRILATLAPQHQTLGRLVTSADGAFAALDSRRAALGDTVRRAPASIHQLRVTLVELERAARPLAPAARGLRSTAAPLTQALRALPAFTAAARPTLRTARAVAPVLGQLGREAAPVVTRLGPVGSSLRSFATALDPVTKLLDVGIADTLGVLQGWARSIQNRDAAGHVFRVSVELGGDLLKALNAYVKPPAAARRLRADRTTGVPTPATSVAPPTSATPSGQATGPRPAGQPASTLPVITLPKLPIPPIKLPGSGADTSSSTNAVRSLLDYLLKP